MSALIVAMAACSSKKKAEDTAGTGAGEGNPDAGIASKEMTYDSAGSDSGSIAGLSSINFEYDKSSLSPESRKKLADNAGWIKENKNVSVQVEGHCDSRGTVEYNLALGERRAQAVKKYLVSLGIDGKRLSVISYGKEKPLASGDAEADYAKNRRANFVPLTK
ncbi:MAG: peptidoglycan-associated lipoprotein Pal [Bdellovibrionales bacterium]|nr:peptidoglycan-associated lipoprotein Pal [Bdellovibrionales bacterium]